MWIVLAVYLLIVAGIGYYAYQKSTPSVEDYFLQSRGVGTFALALTLFATIASAFFYLGIGGAMAGHGVPFMAVGLWQFFTVLAMLYIGTRLWKLAKTFNYITPADLLSHYYEDNKIVRAAIPIIFLLGAFPFMILQMRGAGLSLEVLTDGNVKSTTGIILFTVLALAYVLAGGVRAVVWTDVFQGVYFGGLVVIVFLAIIFVIIPAGNIDSVWGGIEQTKAEMLTFPGGRGVFAWGLLLSLVVFTGIANIGQPAVFQRFFMAKSVKTIRQSAVLYGIIIVPLIYLLLYMTLAGIQLVEPPQPDMLFPTLLNQFAPVLAAFFIAGVVAAGMSTVDSLLVSLSSMVTVDYAEKLFGYQPSQQQAVMMGRVFIVIVAVIAFLLALTSTKALVDLALLQVGFASCVMVPLIGPLLWKRASTGGAIAAVIIGPLAVAAFAFDWTETFGFNIKGLLGFNQNLWGPVVAIVVFVVISLITPAVRSEHQAQFRNALRGTGSGDTGASAEQPAE
jgi:SSS family solute:Na+ symporter